MSTLRIPVEHTSSKNVYVVIQDPADGKVFDHSDDTFKTLGSVTTPTLAATSVGVAGAGRSIYSASVDLAEVHNAGNPRLLLIMAFERAGGSPAPTTDTLIDATTITVQFGQEGERQIVPQLGITINGSDCSLQAWLECGGELVDLDTVDPDATCSIEIWEQGAGSYLFQIDDADDADFALSANQENHFELEQAAVWSEDHAGQNFFARVTITENGNAWSADYPIGIHGGT